MHVHVQQPHSSPGPPFVFDGTRPTIRLAPHGLDRLRAAGAPRVAGQGRTRDPDDRGAGGDRRAHEHVEGQVLCEGTATQRVLLP